jgi:hypothetical protein
VKLTAAELAEIRHAFRQSRARSALRREREWRRRGLRGQGLISRQARPGQARRARPHCRRGPRDAPDLLPASGRTRPSPAARHATNRHLTPRVIHNDAQQNATDRARTGDTCGLDWTDQPSDERWCSAHDTVFFASTGLRRARHASRAGRGSRPRGARAPACGYRETRSNGMVS